MEGALQGGSAKRLTRLCPRRRRTRLTSRASPAASLPPSQTPSPSPSTQPGAGGPPTTMWSLPPLRSQYG